MSPVDRNIKDTFMNILRNLFLLSKEKRESVLSNIELLVTNELAQQGIKAGEKKCPNCNANVKYSRFQKHISVKCPQKGNNKSGSKQVIVGRNTKVVAVSKQEIKICSNCKKHYPILQYSEHVRGCKRRPQVVITSKTIKASKAQYKDLTSSYASNKNKCRFCSRPPMPGGDVCYSCSSG